MDATEKAENATEKAGLTRRQMIKAGGAAAGAAAMVVAAPTLVSPSLGASSEAGNVVFVDGFARPSGVPPVGPSLRQNRFTAIATIGGEGFGVNSDDAYHGPNDNVSDFAAAEYTITTAEMSDGTLTLQGTVVRAVDPASVGKPVVITGTLGTGSGASVSGVPTAIVVDLSYTLGGAQFTGGGVILR